mgnify:CR=1 FL=1
MEEHRLRERRLDGAEPTPWAPADTLPADTLPADTLPGDHPPSRGQRALWFLDRLAIGSAAYHVAAAFRVLGVHNRTEAVFVAAKLGLTSQPAAES